MSPISSRRYSDASTVVTPTENSKHRLLEEFSIDGSDIEGSSRPLPLLYTPAYKRTYKAIRNARIAIFSLTFPKLLIPLFGAPDTLIPLLPISWFTLIVTIAPLAIVMTESWAHKNRLTQKVESVKDNAGDKRVAVLVEDPITGEERWMLQVKAKNDGTSSFDKRESIAAMDVGCGLVFILGMFFAVFWGLDSPKTLGAAMVIMVIQL